MVSSRSPKCYSREIKKKNYRRDSALHQALVFDRLAQATLPDPVSYLGLHSNAAQAASRQLLTQASLVQATNQTSPERRSLAWGPRVSPTPNVSAAPSGFLRRRGGVVGTWHVSRRICQPTQVATTSVASGLLRTKRNLGCLRLLHKFYSTNSTIEHPREKHEVYIAHFFFLKQSCKVLNLLTKRHEAELKNVQWSSLKHRLYLRILVSSWLDKSTCIF